MNNNDFTVCCVIDDADTGMPAGLLVAAVTLTLYRSDHWT